MLQCGLWGILTETVVVEAEVALVVDVEDLEAGAADSAGAEVLIEAEIAETDQCTKLSAAIAEKNAKYHLGLQQVNPFTAVIVLKKWVTEAMTDNLPIDPDLMIESQVSIKARLNWML